MMLKHVVGCGVAICLAASSADAAVINLIDKGGMAGSTAERGFRAAAHYLSSVLTNDVTINLGVIYQPNGGFPLGQADNAYRDYALRDWERQVALTRSNSTLDRAAILPTLNAQSGTSFITNGLAESGYADTNVLTLETGNSRYSQQLYGQTSLLKAIGAIDANDPMIDGDIIFSSDPQVAFDFDPTDGIDPGAIDFLNVALHEIGHALGFVSGIDFLDFYAEPSDGPFGFDMQDLAIFTPLDMFRYSRDPAHLVAGDQPVLDLSVDTKSYFSIDGGKTAVFENGFSTGTYHGDGTTGSHWRISPAEDGECNRTMGTMAGACLGTMGAVTALDLAAFDAIGWNLTFDVLKNGGYRATTADIYRQSLSAVPEPTTWAMTIAGFALLGSALRGGRRTRMKVAFAG